MFIYKVKRQKHLPAYQNQNVKHTFPSEGLRPREEGRKETPAARGTFKTSINPTHTYTQTSTCTQTQPEVTHTYISSGLHSHRHHYTHTHTYCTWGFSFKTLSTRPRIKTWSWPLSDFILPFTSHFHCAIRKLTFHFTSKSKTKYQINCDNMIFFIIWFEHFLSYREEVNVTFNTYNTKNRLDYKNILQSNL